MLLLWAGAVLAFAFEPQRGSDAWLTNGPSLPGEFASVPVSKAAFADLRAEVIAARLRVSWSSTGALENVRVVTSADAPGHWLARDWRIAVMQRHGMNWQAGIPVDSPDVPLVYFLLASNAGSVVASPMRVAHPRKLGLEQPSRVFWPFIEGFEQGLAGWRTIPGSLLRIDATAKHGRSSLAIKIPPGQRSVTVATTRLRGWFVQEHRATGVGLWLRTRQGTGVAAFELLANAFSTNQVIARRNEINAIVPKWTRIELPFSRFPKFVLGDLDLFSIELTAEPETEFLIDDVHLLGRWRSEL